MGKPNWHDLIVVKTYQKDNGSIDLILWRKEGRFMTTVCAGGYLSADFARPSGKRERPVGMIPFESEFASFDDHHEFAKEMMAKLLHSLALDSVARKARKKAGNTGE